MEDLNNRALARAVCDNVSRTTPQFTGPGRGSRCTWCWAIVLVLVIGGFIGGALVEAWGSVQ